MHERPLLVEALGRAIVRDRLAPALLARVGGLVVDVVEDALHHRPVVEQTGHRCHPIPGGFAEPFHADHLDLAGGSWTESSS
jgi:hypothetical protein